MNKSNIKIFPVRLDELDILSVLVGELLQEIMDVTATKAFTFNREETEQRARDLLVREKYWVFVAKATGPDEIVGFVSLYESYALYAAGAYGTIPELYVKKAWRSHGVGLQLLKAVMQFAKSKQWARIEVTTPPLPEFDRTLAFYQRNGFQITGGRKLKMDLQS